MSISMTTDTVFVGERKCNERKQSDEEISCYHTMKWAFSDPSFTSYSTSRWGVCVGSGFTGRVGGRVSGMTMLVVQQETTAKNRNRFDLFFIRCRLQRTIVLREREWKESSGFRWSRHSRQIYQDFKITGTRRRILIKFHGGLSKTSWFRERLLTSPVEGNSCSDDSDAA